jgi:hypothetical protein
MEFLPIDAEYPKFIEGEDPPCAETDPNMFFPEDGTESYSISPHTGEYILNMRASYYNLEGAKAICNSCPFITQCLEYALTDQYLVGIWGGTTEQQRRAIRQKRKIANK